MKQTTDNEIIPIIQVFGAAAYDVENKHYGYSFGRAHLGFQYQFDDKLFYDKTAILQLVNYLI